MVNFRYHVVSIVAVFLALGIGILMGATVIDRATVRFQDRNLRTLEGRLADRRAEIGELNTQIDRWEQFSEEGRRELLTGRLQGVPVVVVAVEGVERRPVDELQALLVSSGANTQGTVWFTGKLNLSDPQDAQALATALGTAPSTRPEVLRRMMFDALARSFAGGRGSFERNPLVPLRDAGFVEYVVPGGSRLQLETLPLPGTRLVFVAGEGSEVPDADFAIPLTQRLTQTAAVPLVAAESGRDRNGDTPAVRAVFVGPLRADPQVAPRLSTVDDLELFAGQVAIVLAVEDLTRGAVGHYGVGGRTSGLLPDDVPG